MTAQLFITSLFQGKFISAWYLAKQTQINKIFFTRLQCLCCLTITIFIILFASLLTTYEQPVNAQASTLFQFNQIRTDHPRLFVTPQTLSQLRNRAQGQLLADYQKLEEQTDGLAQAMLYLISGNETNARNALSYAKSLISDINSLKASGHSVETTIAANVYTLGLIYDWIANSPSISASDKLTLRAGIMSGLDWMDCRDTDGTAHPRCFSEGAWPYHQYITAPHTWESHDANNGHLLPALLAIAHDFTPSENTLRLRAESYTQTMMTRMEDGWLPMLQQTMGQDGGWWMGLMYNGSNLLRLYLSFAALESATGQSLFDRYPFLERHIFFMVYTITDLEKGVLVTMEDMAFPYFRHKHYILSLLMNHFYRNGYARWLVDQIEGPWKSTYNSLSEGYSKSLVSKILWYESSVTATSPEGLPLNAAFPSLGYFVTREGWSPSSVVTVFKSMPYFQYSHNHRNNGHFAIYKSGQLALDSGSYSGGGAGTDHLGNYLQKAVAHNTVLIGMTASGGNPLDPINNPNAVDPFLTDYSSNIYDGTQDYVYLKTNITNAYKSDTFLPKNRPPVSDICIHCQRTMLYLRDISGWPEPVLIVADDLTGTAVYNKSWLLHTENRPVVNGNLITATEGGGKLFTRVLLNSEMTIRTVGGAGREFTSWDGVNHPFTESPWKCPDCKWGNWRIEVSPRTPRIQDQFLHVLMPAEQTITNPPTVTDLSSTAILAAQVNDTVAVFPRDTRADLQSATYTVANGQYTTLKHLVAQTVPGGIYTVNGQSFTASKQGVLTFSLPHNANTTYTLSYTGGINPNVQDNSYYYPYPIPTATPKIVAAQSAVVVAAGDIANSGSNDEATAKLLDAIVAQNSTATVITLGDNAYPDGTAANFSGFYAPTWGRHRTRTRPSPGNHDYRTSGASGYFDYFCSAGGGCVFPSGSQAPYYSFDIGNWHLISLNSQISATAASPQVTWLKQDLAANTKPCTLAYWHKARFSSSSNHGSNSNYAPFWDALYAARADLVLSGHDHTYERFAPQNPSEQADSAGIREFVVGTGGAGLYSFGTPVANSEVRYNGGHGVLKLTLHDASYDWEFVSVAGKTFTDKGSGSCVLAGTTPSPSLTPTVVSCGTKVAGDSDCNGVINALDFNLWLKDYVIYNYRSDYNGDGKVNLVDFEIQRFIRKSSSLSASLRSYN